jgi:hypothetical protein
MVLHRTARLPGVVVSLHVERLEVRRDNFQQARVQEDIVDVGLRRPVTVEGLGLGRGTWAMRGRISRVVVPCVLLLLQWIVTHANASLQSPP